MYRTVGATPRRYVFFVVPPSQYFQGLYLCVVLWTDTDYWLDFLAFCIHIILKECNIPSAQVAAVIVLDDHVIYKILYNTCRHITRRPGLSSSSSMWERHVAVQ